MQGLWKNKLGGWNTKGEKRKSQNFNKYRKENAKYHIQNDGITKSKNSSQLKKRTDNKDYVYGLDDLDEMLFNKPFQGWEYYIIGLDGCSGSKHRKDAVTHIKAIERMAVRNYISNENWDEVLDYRGMKRTVDWDMS